MRIWHYDLIDVLPRNQLQGQWRECLAIVGSIKKNGTPNHLLVNYVLNYDISVFKDYSNKIYEEMLKRGYKPNKIKLEEINKLSDNINIKNSNKFDEHDLEYLDICYYNLKEKYIRQGISDSEWELIDNKYKKIKRIN